MALADSWEAFIRIHGGEPGARYMFEKAIYELLRVENPDKEVHRLNAYHGDGGIDVYVDQGDVGIDIYQCKFYMGKMNSHRWSEIKKSFKRAMELESPSINRWFLCLPREEQVEDIDKKKQFIEEMKSYGVPIEFIDGNQIIQRMRRCDRLYKTDMISDYFTVPTENTRNKEKSLNHKRQEYTICEALRTHLKTINSDKLCDDKYYVPIEIQVEEIVHGRPKRKSADLLSYLKHSNLFSLGKGRCWAKRMPNKTVYLVLGKPGSGKSFVLRKLCLDLLENAHITKKIPVYIDLGKWNGEWTAINPPKMDDLIYFIKKSIIDEKQIIGHGINFNYVFDELLQEGRWLFVLDSFDEIPCLMGSGNNRLLIKKISKLIYDFLTSGKQAGGIIASRDYKQPLGFLSDSVKLNIKELNDFRIKTMLNKYLNNAYDVVDKLFREREDLVVLCRNPFHLFLLIRYVKEYGTDLPMKQVDIYNHFLISHLEDFEGMLKELALTRDDVIIAARRLSEFMQQSSEYGLECPISDFCSQFDEKEKWVSCIQLLKDIGVCHIGENGRTVTFIHRKFQEFLIAKNFKEAEKSKEVNIVPDYTTIISENVGPRDALALYCEIADKDNVIEMAKYCWQTLKENISYRTNIDKDESVILLNTMNFMIDAFRNRRDAVEGFSEEFEKTILENFDNETHFIIQEAMAKSAILFTPEGANIKQLTLKTFELGNNWLSDVVMDNCRLIKKVDDKIETQFTDYFHRKPMGVFVKQFRNTDFALSKAQGFSYIRWMHLLQLINILLISMFIVHSFFTPIMMEKLGLSMRATMEELDSGLSPLLQISKLDKEALTALIKDAKAIELFQLSFFVFWGRKTKTKPLKVGEQYKHTTLETLFSGFLFMMPLYSILFTSIKDRLSSNDILSYNVFLSISVVILVTIIVTDLPYAFHDIYYYFKNYSDILNIGDVCIQLIPSFSVTVFFLIVSGLVLLIPNLLVATFGIVFFILSLVVFGLLVIYSLLYFQKKHFQEHIQIPDKIRREKLVSNMNSIVFMDLQLTYLNRLIDNHSQLIGDWPENYTSESGHRKKYKNDDLEAAISRLEYESKMIERKQQLNN